MNETCNECGRSVRRDSSRFAGRVRDLGSLTTRREAEKPYPKGDFMCARCVGETLGPESDECPLCGEEDGEWDPFAGLVGPCERCCRELEREADAAKKSGRGELGSAS